MANAACCVLVAAMWVLDHRISPLSAIVIKTFLPVPFGTSCSIMWGAYMNRIPSGEVTRSAGQFWKFLMANKNNLTAFYDTELWRNEVIVSFIHTTPSIFKIKLTPLSTIFLENLISEVVMYPSLISLRVRCQNLFSKSKIIQQRNVWSDFKYISNCYNRKYFSPTLKGIFFIVNFNRVSSSQMPYIIYSGPYSH